MNNIGKVIVLSTGLLLSGITVPVVSNQVEAATMISFSKTSYETTANLNLRSGASSNYKAILAIPKGKLVTSNTKIGNWYKVTYANKTGWVSGTYLKKMSTSSPAPKIVKFTKTNYQTTENARIHTGAGSSYSTSYIIPKGKVVSSYEKAGSWFKLTYANKTGWVYQGYLKEYVQYQNISGAYYFTKYSTNLYPTPDTKKAPVIGFTGNTGFYSNQRIINSVGQTWYRVTYKGQTLYINGHDVTSYSSASFQITSYKASKDAYLYSSYGYGFTKSINIPKGATILSSFKIGNWYKASYQGKTGYVNISSFEKVKTLPILKESSISGRTFLTKANLILTNYADTAATIVSTITQGTFVAPVSLVSNGWYKVSYGGKTGYVPGSGLQEVKTGAPLSGNSGYQFLDLRIQSPVTATQINNYIAGYVKSTGKKSVLTGSGQAFIDAGKKYGVNALYLAAHAIHESAFGTSNLAIYRNNLFGFGAYDDSPFISSYLFPTIDQSIEYIAREIKATYLNPDSWKYKGAYLGYSTKTMSNTRIDEFSEGMNFYYASDPNWGKTIASHMQNILAFNKNDYMN
ncbi:MAG: SH3 domain-containing protein, partial [Bacillota bacterium]|nr:SH3 domain-containing protein [Bacillota bacterium]